MADAIERAYLASGGSVARTVERTGASRATVHRLLAACRQRWAAEAEAERPSLRAEHRARVLLLLARAVERNALGPATALERLLLEVDGLLVDRAEIVTARVDPLAGLSLAELRFVRDTGRLPTDEEKAALALPAKTNGSGGGN